MLLKRKSINISKIYRLKLLIKLVFNTSFKFVFSKKIIFNFAAAKYLRFAQYMLNINNTLLILNIAKLI